MSYYNKDAIERFLLKRETKDKKSDEAEKWFKKNRYHLARHLKRSDNSEELKISLYCFIQLYNGNLKSLKSTKKKTNKSIFLLHNIVFVSLKLYDYENAKHWLAEWLKLQPENRKALEVYMNVQHKILGDEKYNLLADFVFGDEAVKHNQGVECVRTGNEAIKAGSASEKEQVRNSSYFTLKNFLLLGVTLLAFNHFKK